MWLIFSAISGDKEDNADSSFVLASIASAVLSDIWDIFSTFSERLGKKINQTLDIKFNNAVQNIPEIHSLCHGLGLIPKRKLLPVQIEILTNAEHNKLFTEVIIENEQKTKKCLQAVIFCFSLIWHCSLLTHIIACAKPAHVPIHRSSIMQAC